MFAHLAEAEAICHTLQEIGLSPSFKQRQWEVWPRSFTISQNHFYEALSSKVQSLHQGRFLHYVTVQSIHWRLWSLQKSWFWPLKTCVSYAQGKKKTSSLLLIIEDPTCIIAVSHSSLFMALKRSVMEHVKKGVFVGQLWKEARNSQLTVRGKHRFLSSSKTVWGSTSKKEEKKKEEKRINTGQNNGPGKWIWPKRYWLQISHIVFSAHNVIVNLSISYVVPYQG